MREIRLKARAKINITLDVVGKRSDGYHDVSMIMQTINLFDKLTIRKIHKDEILLKTNLSFLPTGDQNLVYKVIDFMKTQYALKDGIFVDLHKMIPIAAGLAGGSTDAAAAIKGIDRLFNLKLSLEEMQHIGKQFGADIPYCLVGGTMLAEGIGEKLTQLSDFPKCYVVIGKPKINVSTAFVYNNLRLDQISQRPNTSEMIKAIEEQNLSFIGNNLCNVLEEVTIREYPQIQEIKDKINQIGAYGSLMSGSGSTVFGLFNSLDKAQEASRVLKQLDNLKFTYVTTIYNRKRDK